MKVTSKDFISKPDIQESEIHFLDYTSIRKLEDKFEDDFLALLKIRVMIEYFFSTPLYGETKGEKPIYDDNLPIQCYFINKAEAEQAALVMFHSNTDYAETIIDDNVFKTSSGYAVNHIREYIPQFWFVHRETYDIVELLEKRDARRYIRDNLAHEGIYQRHKPWAIIVGYSGVPDSESKLFDLSKNMGYLPQFVLSYINHQIETRDGDSYCLITCKGGVETKIEEMDSFSEAKKGYDDFYKYHEKAIKLESGILESDVENIRQAPALDKYLYLQIPTLRALIEADNIKDNK